MSGSGADEKKDRLAQSGVKTVSFTIHEVLKAQIRLLMFASFLVDECEDALGNSTAITMTRETASEYVRDASEAFRRVLEEDENLEDHFPLEVAKINALLKKLKVLPHADDNEDEK